MAGLIGASGGRRLQGTTAEDPRCKTRRLRRGSLPSGPWRLARLQAGWRQRPPPLLWVVRRWCSSKALWWLRRAKRGRRLWAVLPNPKDRLEKQRNDSATGEAKLEDDGGEKWRWGLQVQLFIGERGRADAGLHPYPHLQPNRRFARVCYEFSSFWLHHGFFSSPWILHNLRVEARSARAWGARDGVTRWLDARRWPRVAGGERGAAGRQAPIVAF
jgi:hypothetical protein